MTNLAAAVELVAKWRGLQEKFSDYETTAGACYRKCAAELETILVELGRLQSSGNVCQGLTDAQIVEIFAGMKNAEREFFDDSIKPYSLRGLNTAIATAARAYLAALPKGDGWMPIESAPTDGNLVLVAAHDAVRIAYWSDQFQWMMVGQQ